MQCTSIGYVWKTGKFSKLYHAVLQFLYSIVRLHMCQLWVQTYNSTIHECDSTHTGVCMCTCARVWTCARVCTCTVCVCTCTVCVNMHAVSCVHVCSCVCVQMHNVYVYELVCTFSFVFTTCIFFYVSPYFRLAPVLESLVSMVAAFCHQVRQ